MNMSCHKVFKMIEDQSIIELIYKIADGHAEFNDCEALANWLIDNMIVDNENEG